MGVILKQNGVGVNRWVSGLCCVYREGKRSGECECVGEAVLSAQGYEDMRQGWRRGKRMGRYEGVEGDQGFNGDVGRVGWMGC